ncbi:MAG: class II aldolase/adducin family protein [Thermodesulfobacteriota bacterium]
MKPLLDKYAAKLVAAGLAPGGGPLLAGLDADLEWSREAPERAVLVELFGLLNINSLVFCPLAEPHASIVEAVARDAQEAVTPEDCETRTFLHDLPVVREFAPGPLAAALRRRKGCIVPGRGLLAHGAVSPEQGFVTVSSMAFACFVKFFSDHLAALRRGRADAAARERFARIAALLPPARADLPDLARGPFASAGSAAQAMVQAGRATVDYGLVDSYFGNISYLVDDTLHISQTGSSLDELAGLIDPCPLDGSTSHGLTASSELTAHREALLRTGARAVLHGHPRFSVILSMDCVEEDCPTRGACHARCPRERCVADVPVVPGEVGTGPTGLCNTMPAAMAGRRGVLVHGHGLFTMGRDDFREAFAALLAIENLCRSEYFRRVAELSAP